MQAEKIKEKLSTIINLLPDDKIVELFDFAQFLTEKETEKKTGVDSYSLRLQQRALNRIWDSPEEDLYEL